MRIDPQTSIAVCVDVQERLFPHMNSGASLLARLGVFIDGLSVLGIPQLYTEQYPKGLGSTVQTVREHAGTDFTPIPKMSFSCMDEPAFTTALKESKRTTVLLAGIETHVCVLQTALDLLAQDYRPVLVTDGVSSRHQSDRDTAIARLAHAGVTLTSVESILFELTRYAGTQTFKAISRLVK